MSQDRVLALLELLQADHELTGPELARRLGVDERTVRRYAGRLVELGIPVEGRRGRHGGYRLLPGYRLPPLMLTDDEAVAVVLGLLAGERLGLSTGDSALAKIWRVLPAPLQERAEAVRRTFGFAAPARQGAAPAAGVLLSLGEAAARRRSAPWRPLRTRTRWRSCSPRRWTRRAGGYRRWSARCARSTAACSCWRGSSAWRAWHRCSRHWAGRS